MRSEDEIRDRLDELRGRDDEYDELEEGGEALEAEERGFVEALEWVLEERDRGPA
ncbi:hypothetical protein [Halalkalicoccus salilacus]|uniref:hypothetical protein n=1 Tax=Halalkalicoccus TaxID=332246 RepID=UPI002F9614EA